MLEIPLTRGYVALIDEEDYLIVKTYKWHVNISGKKKYAMHLFKHKDDDKFHHYLMHRLIINAPLGKYVDHINGDGLDNRKCNLRLCTNADNQHNQRSIRGLSKYKGVCWDKYNGKWKAAIKCKDKNYNLGAYKDEIEAALAYDRAALRLYGEFAYTNFNGLEARG